MLLSRHLYLERLQSSGTAGSSSICLVAAPSTPLRGRWTKQVCQTQEPSQGLSRSWPCRAEGPELVRLDPEASGGLDGSEAESFGALALLLIGYQAQEVEAVKELMSELEADMVKLLVCTESLAKQPLSAVLEGQVLPEKRRKLHWPTLHRQPRQQRMAVLSGMYTSEVMSVIASYREKGLPETVFCAAVPANYDRIVNELVDDVYGDHNYMMAQDEAEASFIP